MKVSLEPGAPVAEVDERCLRDCTEIPFTSEKSEQVSVGQLFYGGDHVYGYPSWKSPADFDRVKQGDAVVDGSYGHSFIFLNCSYSGSAVSGIVIADQGYQNGDPLAKGEYSYWVGTNLIPVEK